MPAVNQDLHGSAPDNGAVALLLIDVINDLEFPGGAELLPVAMAMAERLADLKQAASRARIPIIYVNDNFGKWRSQFQQLIDHCLMDGVRGQPLVQLLKPEDADYFVLKPKHSGFFATPLETLLAYLGAKTLIITGLTSDSCVMFTAHDAYMRDFRLVVPADCVAAIDPDDQRRALAYMARVMKADVRSSAKLDLERLNTMEDYA
ncbi:MAG: isochorismatase family cysteine hydrolase [Gammaproteobacteria bacterium]